MGGRGWAARCAGSLLDPLRRTTARKVTATVATVAAWTAVAGLGTYGRFPDSTPAFGTDLEDAAASIALAGGDDLAAVSLNFAGLLPGGGVTRPVTLVNDGSAGLSSVTLTSVATASSLLDTDPTDGLRLSVDSCSVPWTADGGCEGEQRTQLRPGPVIRQAELRQPASLVPGQSDHLALTVTLPHTAGIEFSGLSSAVVLTFTAVQAVAAPR